MNQLRWDGKINKQAKRQAFSGVDTDLLAGSKKNKEIVKHFLSGMTYKALGKLYGLSATRIGMILDRQARRANFHKFLMADPEYPGLVERYMAMIRNKEKIIIDWLCDQKTKHIIAIDEAHRRIEYKWEK